MWGERGNETHRISADHSKCGEEGTVMYQVFVGHRNFFGIDKGRVL